MIVSDRALYFIEEAFETIVTPPTKPTKQNPRPPPPPAPYTVTKFILKKRLDLRLLSGVSVTALADTVAVLHFYPSPIPYRSVVATPVKGTPNCQGCGVKLTPAAKKANCPGCGLLLCAKTCLTKCRPFPTLGYPKATACCANCEFGEPHEATEDVIVSTNGKSAAKKANCPGCGLLLCVKTCLTKCRPFPTLGYPKPTACCANCEFGEPHEATEDVIVSTNGKSEMVAMVRKVYRQVMGAKIPINVNSQISYQLALEAKPRSLTAQLNPSIDETMFYVGGPQAIIVHSPAGIPQAKIQAIEQAREERRKVAQERYKREQEEARLKDIEKEKEREEARRKMVEDRKRAKLEAEERAEQDRLERERQVREKREQAARVVADRTTR
eukprot:CAMPEP_0176426520 /NCGR_PEP_ID=MMETSP0127-20121128/11992_1 /TAXON_ID=938130 /ORGANISM="Platyophrya macrostoma, Strain WH" /LENGTH=383 /DNA_ID=CAMNT_0017807805 /DNA_START=9 /DNA_END=1160 /DNA_ORIENTATION=+